MATVSKGHYYWDVRGASSEMQRFASENLNTIPNGSTYLETNGDHNLYIWNADAKVFELL